MLIEVKNETSQPKHQHDSKCCKFVGRYEETDADLYFCNQNGVIPTLIARHSDEGSDYTSGWRLKYSSPELAEAYRLAVAAGLVQIK